MTLIDTIKNTPATYPFSIIDASLNMMNNNENCLT